MFIGIEMYLHRYVVPRNASEDDIRHLVLLVACIPNETVLIRLYIIININSSLKIPRK